jgi:parvulin-like peptidyl-prolyl isomerase
MLRGGDMGFWLRSSMLPEIAALAWDLPAGQVYPEPIQTPMDYHVVKTLSRRHQELAEQRPLIERRLLAETRREREKEAWEQLSRQYLCL